MFGCWVVRWLGPGLSFRPITSKYMFVSAGDLVKGFGISLLQHENFRGSRRREEALPARSLRPPRSFARNTFSHAAIPDHRIPCPELWEVPLIADLDLYTFLKNIAIVIMRESRILYVRFPVHTPHVDAARHAGDSIAL